MEVNKVWGLFGFWGNTYETGNIKELVSLHTSEDSAVRRSKELDAKGHWGKGSWEIEELEIEGMEGEIQWLT
jgi:hypothetical protein